MATRFDWGGESTPQRNERAKESASDFEASPDALDRFFSDAVRAFPSPSRPATEERPSLRALPRTSGSRAETASVRDESDESLEAPGHPLLRAEDVSARFGTAVVEAPSQTAVERPPSERAARGPRQKPPAPVSRRRRMGWGQAAIAALVLVGLAEIVTIGWRMVARPSEADSGALTVTSKPAGAQFLVDGEPVGVTPATVRVRDGLHALEIRSGGPTQVMALRIDKGRDVSRFFDLPVGTAPASVRVESKPGGARVLVDGRVRGRSPVTITGLNPGQHAIRVERGSQFLQHDVMLESGGASYLNLELEALSAEPTEGHGWLAVSMPVELQAYEKGRLVGTSRAGPWQLEAGSHEIEFINQSLGVRLRRTVDVPPGKTATIDLAVPSGLLSISSSASAEIQIDGETAGTAPIVNRPLTAGQHDIVARHQELGERRLSVTIAAGTSVSVKVDFRR